MWAYEHYGVEPDMMVSAKALGGGLPMGALLVTNQVGHGFKPGDHASTFGGNPIVSAASIATIETIIMKDLVAQAAKLGEKLKEGLSWKRSSGNTRNFLLKSGELVWCLAWT